MGAEGLSPGLLAPRAEGLNPNSTHRHLLNFRKRKEGEERKQAALRKGGDRELE